MQSLTIRFKESDFIQENTPEPTFIRTITSTLQGKFIELVYWFDSYIVSPKQIKWIGDIKSKIKILIPSVQFTLYNKEFNYITVSGESYGLKQFSNLWSVASKEFDNIVIPRLKLPPLPYIDTMIQGDIEKLICRELYRPMIIHSKQLYYYHCFNYETVMSGINEALSILGLQLSNKPKTKLCESVFRAFKAELLSNPHKYKQKLSGIDKEVEIRDRTKRLQQSRIISGNLSIETNKKKILEAIKNPLTIKPNGSYNVTAIAKLTGLTRVTITKLIKDLK